MFLHIQSPQFSQFLTAHLTYLTYISLILGFAYTVIQATVQQHGQFTWKWCHSS